MSYKRIEMFEFTCDGHCGVQKTVAARPGVSTHDIPAGWAELRLSPEAHHVVGKTDGEIRYFCASCLALMLLPMWSSQRQVALLESLTTDELEDFDLEDVFDRAKVRERQRLEALRKQATK